MNISGSGGDGLDLSGTLLLCRDSRFEFNSDKGVSVGEKSRADIYASMFNGNQFGIANKDQSTLKIEGSTFQNNNIALAEFIKKPYFGKPAVSQKDNKYLANKSDYKWLGFYRY